MKSDQHIRRIKKFLREMGRPCNTIEIYDYLNTHTKHGILVQSLGNILSKNSKDFIKVGSDVRKAVVSGSYNIGVWDLNLG